MKHTICLALAMALPGVARADVVSDKAAVASLDTEYQAAVKDNDTATMDRILSDDFVLVVGNGKTYSKADLLKEARDKENVYEQQTDSKRNVRVFGDTAVVTALLWVKGRASAGPFEYKLWFSDVYARTPTGWRYVFGQASTQSTQD